VRQTPVKGTLVNTTYLVYVGGAGDENQNVLTAAAVPVHEWASTLTELRCCERSVNEGSRLQTTDVLAALPFDLRCSSMAESVGSSPLAARTRNKVAEEAFSAIRSSRDLRVLSVFAQKEREKDSVGTNKLYDELVGFIDEFCYFNGSYAIVWYNCDAVVLERETVTSARNDRVPQLVLERPICASEEAFEFVQIAGLLAYAAHHAILRDRGLQFSENYLEAEAYKSLLHPTPQSGRIWPGSIENDVSPHFDHELGVRGYPPSA